MPSRAEIVRLHQENPCWPAVRIARLLGLSKQWVSLVLIEAGLTSRHTEVQCLNCGKVFRLRPSRQRKQKFCSVACYHAYTYITLLCEVCGCSFQRRATYVVWRLNHPAPLTGRIYEHIFCSKRCQGMWLGTRYNGRIQRVLKGLV